IAVVGDLEVMTARPHEGAHNRFGEEKAVRIANLHTGDLHIRRHADDAYAVRCRGDRARRMRAVAVVIVPRGRGLVGYATDARSAVSEVHVRRKVWMGEVQAGVQIADHNGGVAARDLVRVLGVDPAHVPLQPRERVLVSSGYVSEAGTSCA